MFTITPEVGIPDSSSWTATSHCVSWYPTTQFNVAVVVVIAVADNTDGAGHATKSSMVKLSIITIPKLLGLSIVGGTLKAK